MLESSKVIFVYEHCDPCTRMCVMLNKQPKQSFTRSLSLSLSVSLLTFWRWHLHSHWNFEQHNSLYVDNACRMYARWIKRTEKNCLLVTAEISGSWKWITIDTVSLNGRCFVRFYLIIVNQSISFIHIDDVARFLLLLLSFKFTQNLSIRFIYFCNIEYTQSDRCIANVFTCRCNQIKVIQLLNQILMVVVGVSKLDSLNNIHVIWLQRRGSGYVSACI